MAQYLSVEQIYLRMETLAANEDYRPYIEVITLRHKTVGDQVVQAMRIGNRESESVRIPVLIVGGIHAREWAAPDALLEFAERLLECFHTRQAFVDPRFVMPNPRFDADDPFLSERIVFDETIPGLCSALDVQRIFERLDLYIIPTANPDGRKFSQDTGYIPFTTHETHEASFVPWKKWWRKNLRDMGKCLDDTPAIGVDINRNFSPLPAWDYRKYYDNNALNHARIEITDVKLSSEDSRSLFFEAYKGDRIPENETQNIIDLVNEKRFKFYLDVHSYARKIYYPWGINNNQSTNKFKSQFNNAWDNIPGNPLSQQGRPFNDRDTTNYEEYFPNDPPFLLMTRHASLARFMSGYIQSAAGSDMHAKLRSRYTAKQAFDMYSSPGTSSDYVFSTQFEVDPVLFPEGRRLKLKEGVYPVISLSGEFGHNSDGFFWPNKASTSNQYLKVRREIHFGIIALLKYAANFGVVGSIPGDPQQPPINPMVIDDPSFPV